MLCSFIDIFIALNFLSGGLGIILSLLILFYLHDNPSVHPRISLAELEYITSNQENVLTEKV